MDASLTHFLQEIIVTFPAFLLALVVHEFSHAWMALRFGDQTAVWSGRLTLNPLAHIDPVGTVVLPLLGMWFQIPMFGWAKPVPIDPRQFRNYRKGLFWVSFAGPLSNLLFGLLSTLVFYALARFSPGLMEKGSGTAELLRALVLVNYMLAVFNMIPIPPMDGSNIVLSFLKHGAAQRFMQLQQYSFMLIILLMYTGGFRILAYPVYVLVGLSEYLAAHVFGLA